MSTMDPLTKLYKHLAGYTSTFYTALALGDWHTLPEIWQTALLHLQCSYKSHDYFKTIVDI